MKYLLIITLLFSIYSCRSKNSDTSTPALSKDTVLKPIQDSSIGSTPDNINNPNYAVIEFKIEEKLCIAIINQYFKNYSYKKSFPFSLWITIETKEKNENGHPLPAEGILFNTLEDSLVNSFISKTPFCYIGRTTRDGYREVMIYVSDKTKASEIMKAFIQHNSFNRKIEFAIDPDPTWESVAGFIE